MFKLNILKTELLHQRDNKDSSASEAIETIYPHSENDVIFHWDDIQFKASLKFDISDSWSDILGLMQDLKSNKKEFKIQFPSQSFWHLWKFKEFEKSKYEIEAFWGFENTKKIKVEKSVIRSEITKLIESVEADLKKQNYQIENLEEYLK